tara:strand:+ start:10301 stop:12166 length:1866 start_codon:yes stop_codon:yes gene_type:complete
MCGIAGFVIRNKEILNNFNLKTMYSIMKNRGPDNQGSITYNKKNYYLSLISSRLAILDLDKRSNQPFKIDNLVLIFNGEIYNYIELRNFLKKKNIKFKTASDTEVVLRAYQFWGKECVKFFEGMWSMAIKDTSKNILFLSRDPFGEKPLYYYYDNKNFIFGSEIKYIFNIDKRSQLKEVNINQINKYLNLGYKSLNKNDHTYFKKIRKFPSGTNLTFNLSKNFLKFQKFYEPKNSLGRKNFSIKIKEEEHVENIKFLLQESIKKRLRADVPLAFCLSGGVDSGALVSIATKKFNIKPNCYSIIDKDKRYDEEKNIDHVQRDTNCKLEKIYINEDKNFLYNLEKLVNYHDSPISTISYYAHSKISEKASKDKHKVILSGTGADEIFTGYYDHHLFHLAEIKNLNDIRFKENLRYWKKFVKPYVRNPFLQKPNIFFKNTNFRKHIYLDNNKIKKYFIKPTLEQFKEKKISKSNLKNRMLNELFYESVPIILKEDDFNSMFNSIENRSPYLDKKLIEYLFNIPTKFFIKNGYAKYLLRESTKNILHEKVRLDRKKVGFNLSLQSLKDYKNNNIKEYLLNNNELDFFINKKNLKRLLNKKNLNNTESKFIFSLINTQIFLKQYNI